MVALESNLEAESRKQWCQEPAIPSETWWPRALVLVLQDVTTSVHVGGYGTVWRAKLHAGGSASAPAARPGQALFPLP